MSQPKHLLVEEINPMLTESKKDSSGKWIIESIMMQSNVKNRNGRVYPKPVLDEAANKYVEEYVSQNRALGELNHPTSRHTVDPSLAVIKIESLKENGNDWTGKASLIGTQQGQNLAALLEAGVKLGISSRALGSIKESSGVNVVNTLELYALDVVANPSAPSAWLDALMEETEWVFCKDTKTYMLAEEIKHQIKKATSKNLEATVLNAWNRYCKQLNLR